MRRTSLSCLTFVLACMFAFGSDTQAQTNSTVGQNDDQAKRRKAPVALAQKTEKPATGSQQRTDPSNDAKNSIVKKPVQSISRKRRIELMTFIKKHHPELRPLLISLEKTRSAQFESALRSLDRDVKNLQALNQRSPHRYQRSLDSWIIKSKIRLVAAQLVTKKTDKAKLAVKQKLTNLLNQQHKLRDSHLTEDVEQAKKRFDKLRAQLKEHKRSGKSKMAQQLKAYTDNAEKIQAAQKKATEIQKRQAAKAAKKPTANTPKTPKVQDKKNNSDKK